MRSVSQPFTSTPQAGAAHARSTSAPTIASITAQAPHKEGSVESVVSRWLGAVNPLAPVQRRIRRWWLQRLPPADSLTLTQRNVYILPTGAGYMLCVTLGVLLLASMNYQLNLGYLLTFLLAGSMLVGMHMSHATLRGLGLHLRAPEPCFLGEAAALEVQLHSPHASTRYGIGVYLEYGQLASLAPGGRAKQPPSRMQKRYSWTDVPAKGQVGVQVTFEPQHRGRHALPWVGVETQFPLGTFRVWALWRPAATVLVYPRPELSPPPLPVGQPKPGGAGRANSQGVGEFDGVRAYRRGDPLKLVVWKKAAKSSQTGTDDLISRDTQQAQQLELWLDSTLTGLLEPEARVSRLTAWVLKAEQQQIDYGLRLPGVEIAPGQGPAHWSRCLTALALC